MGVVGAKEMAAGEEKRECGTVVATEGAGTTEEADESAVRPWVVQLFFLQPS